MSISQSFKSDDLNSQITIDSLTEVTSWGSREAWYRVIRVLPDICPWADIAVALSVFTYGQNW